MGFLSAEALQSLHEKDLRVIQLTPLQRNLIYQRNIECKAVQKLSIDIYRYE